MSIVSAPGLPKLTAKFYPAFAKLCFLVLWVLLSARSSYAQIVLTTADTIAASGIASQFEIVGYGGVVNQGSSAVNLRWLRVGSQLPTGWSHTICDLNSCYPPFVDSADFTLNARDTSNLDGHFYPNGQAGAGYQRIRLSILPANTPLMVVTFVASTASSATQTLFSAPNKAAWKLIGQELVLAVEEKYSQDVLRIMDQAGRVCYQTSVTDLVERISLDTWPSGVYTAVLERAMGSEHYRFVLNR
jgi:hypothetical protein